MTTIDTIHPLDVTIHPLRDLLIIPFRLSD